VEGPTPPVRPFVDLSDEQVHWDLSEHLSYSQYLHLDKLLDAQHPLSYHHDEMLFMIIHQVSELWMKLCLHELNATIDCVRRDDLGPSFKMLARVSTIQTQLQQSWDVLATITPSDYSAFRNSLGRASGFQSPQYRMLEFLIGNKNADMIKVFRGDAANYHALDRALRAPSLYDEVLRLLSRRGLDIPRRRSTGISHSPTRRASGLPPRGSAFTTTRPRIGICTGWPSGWWTSTTSFSCGASPTPRPSSASSATSAARAARAGSLI